MTTHTLQLYVEIEAEGDLDEAEWLNRAEVLKCAVETICYDNLGDCSALVSVEADFGALPVRRHDGPNYWEGIL
jgi:hypothetical protein